ncbi:hypothetical protein A2U01_0082672, partial [Trifolium medium]|nr:hypothetical protein [Trifolium medium]
MNCKSKPFHSSIGVAPEKNHQQLAAPPTSILTVAGKEQGGCFSKDEV